MKCRYLAIICAIAVMAVVGVSYAEPRWAVDLGLDFWSLPALQSDLEEARRIADELDERSQATRRRMQTKQKVVDDLLAERISFAEAASRFKRLNRIGGVHSAVQLQFPDVGEDEACCRNLIHVVVSERRVVADPEPVARRLEAALAELKGMGGGEVYLPD